MAADEANVHRLQELQRFGRVTAPSQVASVVVRDIPGRVFTGRVSRTSGALDAATRTMVAQVDEPNPGHELLAGVYAQVTLSAVRTIPTILLPANALVIRADGPQVAMVRVVAENVEGEASAAGQQEPPTKR